MPASPEPSPEERKVIDVRNDATSPGSADPELARDVDDVAAGLPVGIVSGSQARGAWAYGPIGLLAGLLIGAGLALIPIGDWAYGPRLALFGGICAFAGLVAGAVFGGGREPEAEGEIDTHLDAGESGAPRVLRDAHIDEDMAHRTEDARHQPH